ncbi:prepilin-type N-terminal cleavage/methylation domain-containing protein [Sulfuricurvum sp.]|uniref:type IV pilus modification PilV family protein n=1 Tax=Sulfuricurvum sp. TaxID=2025608 RepID=UPI0035656144
MALTKGFSLIETLVAITIASIATMALMKVISHASTTSANALKRFNSSIMMGLVAGEVNDTFHGRTLSVDEILRNRYSIDHPVIRESLQSATYEIRLLPKEIINPLMNTPVNGMGSSVALSSIAIQKVILQNPNEKRSFFTITSGLQ